MLRLLAEERAAAQAIADRVELVWSGTEVMAGASRDTAVVVQELFREAREAVPLGWSIPELPPVSTPCGTFAIEADVDHDVVMSPATPIEAH